MNSASPLRNTIARKPSHLGSNEKPAPVGTSSALFANIGSIGGSSVKVPGGRDAGSGGLGLAVRGFFSAMASRQARGSRDDHHERRAFGVRGVHAQAQAESPRRNQ